MIRKNRVYEDEKEKMVLLNPQSNMLYIFIYEQRECKKIICQNEVSWKMTKEMIGKIFKREFH